MQSSDNDLDTELKSAHYQAALETFVSLAKDQGIQPEQIGYFGKTNHPGISDLDVLVIAEDLQLTKLSDAFEKKRNNDQRFKYIFFHSPVYVPAQLLEKTSLMHTFDNLTPVAPGCPQLSHLANQRDTQSRERDLSWLTFILSIGAQTLYQSSPQSHSLRFNLLLMRNIGHSLNRLSNRTDANATNLRISEFRKQAIRNTLPLKTAVFETKKLYLELLQKTQSVFEAGNDKQKSLLLKRRWLISSGDSSIFIGKPFNYLTLPSSLLTFAESYLHPHLRSPNETAHFKAYEEIERTMNRLKLPNSFPSPFQLKRIPIFDRTVRRVVDTVLTRLSKT